MNPVNSVAAIAVLALLTFAGRNWLHTTIYEMQSPRLPASFHGYCIVQISDLHNHRFGRDHTHLLRSIRQAEPDLIMITGDLIYLGSWDPQDMKKLALQLGTMAPVYFVSGNHDVLRGRFSQLVEDLESAGVHVLQAKSATLCRGTDSIVVAGIPDTQAFRRRAAKGGSPAEWESALSELRQAAWDAYTVLLSHRPEYFSQYAALGFDLVLAGHAHGGQVRIPLIGALYAPDQGWLPRFTSGVHASERTKMVVSQGLGNSWFKIRLFNRPELVVVRLRRPPG